MVISLHRRRVSWDLQFQSGVLEVLNRTVAWRFVRQGVCPEVRFCEKSRGKCSFWKLGLSLLVKVSWKMLVLEAWIVTFGESLVENAFGSLDCYFWWRPCLLAVPLGSCANACVIFSGLAVLGAVASCCKLSSREFTFARVALGQLRRRWRDFFWLAVLGAIASCWTLSQREFAVPLGGCRSVSDKSVKQERPARVSWQECPARVSSKCVRKECQEWVSSKECQERVSNEVTRPVRAVRLEHEMFKSTKF